MHKLFVNLLLVMAPVAFASLHWQNAGQEQSLYTNTVSDSLQVRKLNHQNGRDIITINPNPSNGNMQVKNQHSDGKEIHFYVFDLDGVMIENLRLQPQESRKVSGLGKGVYLYDVFEKDESIERGKIIVE